MADEAFQRGLLRRLGALAVRRVRPLIVSYKGKPITALQRALRAVLLSDTLLTLQIPHFWAVYVHDGRSVPFGPQRSTFLIWWKNPHQDPRLAGGSTPERANQLRRLSFKQFRDALKKFREEGPQSPVIVVPQVKRPQPPRPSPFFSNEPGGGMHGFVNEANKLGEREFKIKLFSVLKKQLGATSFLPQIPVGGSIQFKVERESATARF